MQEFFNLDFDDLVEDIKNYIKNNTTLLSDYNFEGSAITELIKVLAYATQNPLFYLNMISNEMFISTAEIESNIYKLASALNYIPKRKNGGYFDVTFTSAAPVTLSKWDSFATDSATLYYIGDDISITASESSVIRLYSGEKISSTLDFSESTAENFNTFTLSDGNNIDDTYFYVVDSIGEYWKNANRESFNLQDKAYYLDYSTGTLALIFDNGNLFVDPVGAGLDIILYYLKVTGTLDNIKAVTTITTIDAPSSLTLASTFSDSIQGGTAEDTLTEIKLKAPLFHNTRYRAVTEDDYNTVIKNYGAYDDMTGAYIWGGDKEYIDPTDMSLQPDTVSASYDIGTIYYTGLNSSESYVNTVSDTAAIESYLDNYRIISMDYRFVDPKFLNISSTIYVSYNENVTSAQKDSIESTISTYITGLDGFNQKFRKSDLIRYIDSITGIDYVYADIACCVTSRGFVESATPLSAVRIWNAINSSVTFSGTCDSLAITSSGSDLLLDGSVIGNIDYNLGVIYVNSGTLTDTFNIIFDLESYEYIEVQRETYMNFESPTISRI